MPVHGFLRFSKPRGSRIPGFPNNKTKVIATHMVDQNADTAWMRLKKLLAEHLVVILDRERSNDRHIYLYDAGEYWVAFEQSAWQLCRLFPHSDISVLHMKTYPFPVVMASVANRTVQIYYRRHVVKSFMDHTVLAASSLPSVRYHRWHKEVVDGLQ